MRFVRRTSHGRIFLPVVEWRTLQEYLIYSRLARFEQASGQRSRVLTAILARMES